MMNRFKERLNILRERLKDPKRRLADFRLFADDRLEKLQRIFHHKTQGRKHDLIRLESRLHQVCPLIHIRDHQFSLDHMRKNMIAETGNILERFNNRLCSLTAMLDSLSPLAVLKRGYSIVRRLSDGKIIRRADDISLGCDVHVKVLSGSFETRVTKIYEE
jgi:exodeoxyribonuclease VII large subunit